MTDPHIDLNGANVLLVDDMPDNLRVLRKTLEQEGYELIVATSGEDGLKLARNAHPDLILLDVMMPGMDGFETCRRLKADPDTRDIPVVFITARTETDAVVEGFGVGGVDYIVKPFRDEEVLARVRTHLRIDRLTRELQAEIEQRKVLAAERNRLADRLSMVTSREAEHWGIAGFVGESTTIRQTLENISMLKGSEATVLITGESGTGKELVARAIHHGSPRASGPFVPVNCSAIPRELAESTLFGHVRGAFTGADRDRTGYFQLADGGTLFLDEIGDMTPDIQGKILRILEDGLALPVGAAEETPVDVRVLAATNRDLQSAIASARFRQDLYFRLARFPVHVPPLRERKEDIPMLAQHFLRMFATEMGVDAPTLTSEVLALLSDHDYPGNVRELKNVIEHGLIQAGGMELCVEHLHLLQPSSATHLTGPPNPEADPETPPPLPLNLREAEETLIRRALDQTHGNIAAAARLLDTNRKKVYRYLRQHPDPRVQ